MSDGGFASAAQAAAVKAAIAAKMLDFMRISPSISPSLLEAASFVL
jgi:hypothetical protein